MHMVVIMRIFGFGNNYVFAGKMDFFIFVIIDNIIPVSETFVQFFNFIFCCLNLRIVLSFFFLISGFYCRDFFVYFGGFSSIGRIWIRAIRYDFQFRTFDSLRIELYHNKQISIGLGTV